MTEALPLDGIKVLDVSTYIAGPAAAVVLGDYGADVIKVEQPGEGDPNRTIIGIPSYPKSAVNYPWQMDARNKRSIALDLKHESGRAALDRLIPHGRRARHQLPAARARAPAAARGGRGAPQRAADLCIADGLRRGRARSRPGRVRLHRLFRPLRPRSIRCATTASRRTSPCRPRATGPPPWRSSPASCWRSIAASGPARAPRSRPRCWPTACGRTGSMRRPRSCGAFLPQRPPRDRPRTALANLYRTRDDRWLQLSIVQEETMWPRVCRAIERPELEHDARFAEHADAPGQRGRPDRHPRSGVRDRHRRRMASAPQGQPADLQPHRPPPGPGERRAGRRSRRGHPIGQPGDAAHPRRPDPARLRRAASGRPGAGLGQHTDEILREAGFSAAEIAELRSIGAAA